MADEICSPFGLLLAIVEIVQHIDLYRPIIIFDFHTFTLKIAYTKSYSVRIQ